MYLATEILHMKPIHRLLYACALLFILPRFSHAQNDSLRLVITRITKSIDADVGVALKIIGSAKDTLSLNSRQHYPMQSTYKFPQAMYMLNLVDHGKLSLDQKIQLQPKDLLPDTWSPLHDKYPEGHAEVTLRELLWYSVSKSDNNACDILFRLGGDPQRANEYIHSLGVKEMNIAATEAEMHVAWNVQFKNWSTPHAMLSLLEIFKNQTSLSSQSSQYLWNLMEDTTKPNRLKGLLPLGTVVARKAGTSGNSDRGINAATHDVGIITLPNGKHLALVVFVSNTKAKEADRELIIAKIAFAAWNYYSRP